MTIRFGGHWLAWLVQRFAPRIYVALIRRSALTGKASITRGGKAASITATVERL